MKTLTIIEALKAGYTKYCLANDGFQFLKDIDGMDKEHLLREDIRLVEIEPHHPAGMSAEEIAETLAEQIWCNHHDQTGDDTDDVADAIKEIDFTEVENKISEVLSKLNYYTSTDIKLIADEF